jgi:hypothetical protein
MVTRRLVIRKIPVSLDHLAACLPILGSPRDKREIQAAIWIGVGPVAIRPLRVNQLVRLDPMPDIADDEVVKRGVVKPSNDKRPRLPVDVLRKSFAS